MQSARCWGVWRFSPISRGGALCKGHLALCFARGSGLWKALCKEFFSNRKKYRAKKMKNLQKAELFCISRMVCFRGFLLFSRNVVYIGETLYSCPLHRCAAERFFVFLIGFFIKWRKRGCRRQVLCDRITEDAVISRGYIKEQKRNKTYG